MNFPGGITVRSKGRTLVSAATFGLADNGITFLFGESGIGKSLLSQAAYGLLDSGELDVTVDGKPYNAYLASAEVAHVQQHGFFVFQEPSSHLNPLMKISEQLAEGSLGKSTVGDAILSYFWKDRSREELASIVDIFPKPFRPSGGEKQRVLLSMAFRKLELFRQQPPGTKSLFVFDEPTGSLDNSYRDLFLKALFATYSQRAFTGLVITHDYSIISEIQRSFRNQAGNVFFRELRRTGDGTVEVEEFKPRDYLTWLDSAGNGRLLVEQANKPFLDMASRFSVIGRKYHICSDDAFSCECPLQVRPGEMVYLKAASGVGKTTLLKVIMGLFRAQQLDLHLGTLHLTEKTPSRVWRSRVWGSLAGMVFQHADEALNMQSSVRESFAGLPSRPSRTAIESLLELLFEKRSVPIILGKQTGHLSGGQKQRLNILRTLATRTPCIVFDEPLNGLDFESVKRVLALLEQKRREGCAMLMISHNEEIFDTLAGVEQTRYLELVE